MSCQVKSGVVDEVNLRWFTALHSFQKKIGDAEIWFPFISNWAFTYRIHTPAASTQFREGRLYAPGVVPSLLLCRLPSTRKAPGQTKWRSGGAPTIPFARVSRAPGPVRYAVENFVEDRSRVYGVRNEKRRRRKKGEREREIERKGRSKERETRIISSPWHRFTHSRV